jgi:hypothetical protein
MLTDAGVEGSGLPSGASCSFFSGKHYAVSRARFDNDAALLRRHGKRLN